MTSTKSLLGIPCNNLNFRQNKGMWFTLAFFSALLLIFGYYELKTMTSVYKQDFGNGVIIYADDFVKTGKWVFDCNYSRLISRTPLATPLVELSVAGKLKIGKMYALNDADQKSAKEAIRAITLLPDWYKELRYLYSGLDEYSDLRYHSFYLLAEHARRTWAVEVDQSIGYGGQSSFKTTAQPYQPETYVDYAKALQAASKSCPAPQ